MEEIKVENIHHLFELYATEKTKDELRGKIQTTVIIAPEWGVIDDVLVQFFGLVLEYDSKEEPKIDSVAKELIGFVNWGVDRGYLKFGLLAPLTKCNLLNFSNNGQHYLDNNGRVISLSDRFQGVIYKGRFRKRVALLIYIPCTISREEINEEFKREFNVDFEISNLEGMLPSWRINQDKMQ